MLEGQIKKKKRKQQNKSKNKTSLSLHVAESESDKEKQTNVPQESFHHTVAAALRPHGSGYIICVA